MLSKSKKANILKTVSIFSGTPDDTLAQVSPLLEEITVKAGVTIFEKEDLGTAMYIIDTGRVRVHDGDRTLNYLREREVFGEMAALDPERRSASVTAVEDTRLLRLDQEALYNLMSNRPEVARGVIHVLSQHLRARMRDLGDLRTHLERVILPLGIALSTEQDLDRLLERILVEAKFLCNADAGTLYLLGKDDRLRFSIVLTDSLNVAMGGTTGKEIPFPPLLLYDEASGDPNDDNVATHVALHGHSINIPDIYHAQDFDFSGTKAFDKENNYRSISNFTVPLKNHVGQVIGVLQLFNAQDPQTGDVVPFDAYQQLVVESLASQAAVALNTQALLRQQEQLLQFEHDLKVGRRIQADFLPQKLPQFPGWEIAARFQPAREVAGDFYDAFPLPDGKLALVIADVCDKGVGSALYMALSRTLIRAFHWLDLPPDDPSGATPSNERTGQRTSLLGRASLGNINLINNYMAETHGHTSMFVTLFFGVLDLSSGELAYINGGHNPPVIAGPDGTLKAHLEPTGPVVGLFPHVFFDIQQVTLEPGDMLMTFTDGVPEARDPDGEFFSDERLLSLLEDPVPSAAVLLDRIEAELRAHVAGSDQHDDITMLAVRRAFVSRSPAS